MSWLSDMFGGKKKQQDDPLAGVRAQLQSLSSQVPELVARQKANTASQIAALKKTGSEQNLEETRAERGFGANSIFTRMQNELIDKLAKTQAEADLAADQWGVTQQGNLLGQIGAMTPQPQPEAESPVSKILAAAGLGIGQGLGFGGKSTDTEGSGSIFQNAADLIKNKSGSKTTISGGESYNEDSGGFMDIAKLVGKGVTSFIPGGSFISSLFGG